jgi:2-polyprenyl-3-methyl-5-hydroxy-6-metoxy-1,4-benzoquinol methylase
MFGALARRRREAEFMDDPALCEREHAHALSGLARINAVSRTAAAIWPPIARLAATRSDSSLSLLDVACGGGEVALTLARRARRHGVTLTVSGCDISPTAVRFAATHAEARSIAGDFFHLNALSDPLSAHYDVITTTLFLHHLENADIVALLQKLAAHADCLIVSDLLRDSMGYALAWLGTRLFSASRIVHVDGLRSVRAALDMPEARSLVAAAGLEGAYFKRVWPRRFVMVWRRASAEGSHEVG